MQFIRTILTSIMLFATATFAFADIDIPLDEFDNNDDHTNHRHRSRPIMKWCHIDTASRTITTTFDAQVVTYCVCDETETVIATAYTDGEAVDAINRLQSGTYTLCLVTESTTYAGSFDID